jgi:hypothetical protein
MFLKRSGLGLAVVVAVAVKALAYGCRPERPDGDDGRGTVTDGTTR